MEGAEKKAKEDGVERMPSAPWWWWCHHHWVAIPETKDSPNRTRKETKGVKVAKEKEEENERESEKPNDYTGALGVASPALHSLLSSPAIFALVPLLLFLFLGSSSALPLSL